MLTKAKIIEICTERFRGWTEKFAGSHATPQIAIGVGHDAQAGQIVLCVVDDPSMTNQVVAGFLRYAADLLEGKG